MLGLSTHPHWDHLLWHSPVRRRAALRHPHAGAHAASEARARGQKMAAESASAIPSRAVRARHPAARRRRAGAGRDRRASGACHRPRYGPPRGAWPPARRRHAVRRPDPASRPSPAQISWTPASWHSTGWVRRRGRSMSWSQATAPLPRPHITILQFQIIKISGNFVEFNASSARSLVSCCLVAAAVLVSNTT